MPKKKTDEGASRAASRLAKAGSQSMTKAERRDRARKAAIERWAQHRAAKASAAAG